MHATDKAFIAETTARMLLEVKAVLFSEDKPFIFTSGWASPVYIDCRRLISFPRVRQILIDFGATTILRDAGVEATFLPFDGAGFIAPDEVRKAIRKDTVLVWPGEKVKVAMNFAPYAGMYMYHCHILEHEDMTMMRNCMVMDPMMPGM